MTLQGLNSSIRSKMTKYHEALETRLNAKTDYEDALKQIESYCQAYPSYAEKPKNFMTYMDYIKQNINRKCVLLSNLLSSSYFPL